MRRGICAALLVGMALGVVLSVRYPPCDRAPSESPSPGQSRSLFKVIRDGNTPRVRALMAGDAKLVQARDAAGFTPLHVAVDAFQLDVVELLLASGADVDAVSQQGLTPLHCAAQKGHWRIAKRLVKAGARVDAVDEEGRPPLNWAAYLGYDAIVELLVQSGASPKLKDRRGMSALDYALRLGPHDLVGLLCAGDVATVERLHRPCRRSIWHDMARRGLFDEVMAAVISHPGLLANEDCFQSRLVLTAYRARHRRLGTRLANLGGEVNQAGPFGLTLLHVVVQHGDFAGVKRLVSQLHPNQDVGDDEGQTPLHWAVRLRHYQVASFLVGAGADPSRLDSRGATPITLSRLWGVEPLERASRSKEGRE